MRQLLGFLFVLIVYFAVTKGIQFLLDIIEWLNRMSKLKQHQLPPSPAVEKSAEDMRREVDQFVHAQSPFTQELVFENAAAVPSRNPKKTKATRSKHSKIAAESMEIHTGVPALPAALSASLHGQQGTAADGGLFRLFDSPQSIQTAVVMSEILRRPEW